METQFLQTFVMVVDTGSMAEAARRLDITATSVAQQIKSLEREFGAPLLARSGRTVQLTQTGHQLLDGVRTVLHNLKQLRQSATDGGFVRTLRLGSIHTALHSIAPDMLAGLMAVDPALRVEIEQDASMALYDAVLSGGLDAAICIHPQFELAKTFGWYRLREESLVVLVPDALAGRDPDELLRSQPLIRYGRSQWGGRQAERYLLQAGIAPRERFELISLTAIAMLVHRGLGVSLVPDANPPLPAGLRITKLPLPQSKETREVGLLWLRASARSSIIRLLVQQLQAQ